MRYRKFTIGEPVEAFRLTRDAEQPEWFTESLNNHEVASVTGSWKCEVHPNRIPSRMNEHINDITGWWAVNEGCSDFDVHVIPDEEFRKKYKRTDDNND